MSKQEDPARTRVRAEDNSNAIGNVSARDINAPIISGNQNQVELTYIYEASEDEAPLSSDEIERGLVRLSELLPERAPILQEPFKVIAKKLRDTLGPASKALSPALKKQHDEQLAKVKPLCSDVTDTSFHAICTGQEPAPYDARCPFRGLQSFGPLDREFFFGREELIGNLVGRIQAHPFLAVLGASGSGKSSLVMAGLVPALGLDYAIFRPGSDPLAGLKSARGKPLIVVDQFEELFTLTSDKTARTVFITDLLSTTQRVVITMRSDFFAEVATYRDLNEKIQAHLENVPPMDARELRSAMEKQADQVGLSFEGDLSQQILEDVEGEPGAMPLLQHALLELWNRRHGRLLRAAEYRDFGGVKQAITRTAEKVYNECTGAEQEKIRDIFLQLTHIDDQEDRRDTRRRIPLNDLATSSRDTGALPLFLDKLATARLIVQTRNDKLIEVEVAHEALIRHWERLRGWVHDNRNNLIFHRHLIDDAQEWDRGGRDASYLYRDKRLLDTLQWAKSNSAMLRPLESEFLKHGQDRRITERRRKILRASSLGIFGFSIATVVYFALTGGLNVLLYQPLPPEWVPVPAGEFRMGSELWMGDEKPVHVVHVDDFEIGKYEVTNRQYLQCVKAGICVEPDNPIFDEESFAEHPVTHVSWRDAAVFCEWVDPNGSLPTEAEWEKAARGTDERTYPWGDDFEKTYTNSEGSGTAIVGSFPKDVSPYGAYDMGGNVWEWVADLYYDYSADTQTDQFAFNLTEQEDDSVRMARGGTWTRIELYARTTSRALWSETKSRTESGGFRCARQLTP